MKKLIIGSIILFPLLLQGCYSAIEKNQSAATISREEKSTSPANQDNMKDYVSEYERAVNQYSVCSSIKRDGEKSQNKVPDQNNCDLNSLKNKVMKIYEDINFGEMEDASKKEKITYRYAGKNAYTFKKKFGFEDEVGDINARLFVIAILEEDINNAANIYSESSEYINDDFFEKACLSFIMDNLGKIKAENLPALSAALKRRNFVYEAFIINTLPANDFSEKETKLDIINTLKRFNCDDDVILWLNFFVKSNEKYYFDLIDEYNRAIASLDKEQISMLNTETRNIIKEGKTPPLSHFCEIKEYKRFYF